MKNLKFRYLAIFVALFFTMSIFPYSISDVGKDTLKSLVENESEEKEEKKPDIKESESPSKKEDDPNKKVPEREKPKKSKSSEKKDDGKKEKGLGKFYPKGF